MYNVDWENELKFRKLKNTHTFTMNCLFRVETELTYSEQVMYRCLVVLNERKLKASWRLNFPNKEYKPRLQSYYDS